MTGTQAVADVIRSVAALIGSFAWPLLVLFVVVRFREPLADFFKNLQGFTVKVPGMEASAQRQIIQAGVLVGNAMNKPGAPTSDPGDVERAVDQLADLLPRAGRRGEMDGATILWVDDHPDNNVYERKAMETLGVRFVLSTSTEDALGVVQRERFDTIISDMGRPPDPRAGYTFLDALRADGDDTPFVIYAASRAAEHVRKAERHGAVGCTNSPQELIELVLRGLRQNRATRLPHR